MCHKYHVNCKMQCKEEVSVAMDVVANQPLLLADLWKKWFPNLVYKSYSATKKLGKMPLVFVNLPGSDANRAVYVIEKELMVDYVNLLDNEFALGGEENGLLLDIDSTDKETEQDPEEEWCSISSITDDRFKEKVCRRRKYLREKARRQAARKVAKERILRRRICKSTSSILSRHPNIGALIEEEVKSAGVGADK